MDVLFSAILTAPVSLADEASQASALVIQVSLRQPSRRVTMTGGHRSRFGGKSGAARRRFACLAKLYAVPGRAMTSSKPSRRQGENAAASVIASGSKFTAMQHVPS